MPIVIISLGLALLAGPAGAQSLIVPDGAGGGWVFGPTSRESGPLLPDYGAGQMVLTPNGTSTIHPDGMGGGIVLTPNGTSTIHPDGMGGGIVIDEHGGVRFLTLMAT